MSDRRKKDSTSRNSKSNRKFNVANYFIVPFIFAFALLLIALPLNISFKSYINNEILDGYNKKNNYSYYDEVAIDRTLPLSDQADVKVSLSEIKDNEGYGKIICENAGINCEVYNGPMNKKTLRYGASTVEGLPGTGKAVTVFGYNTKYFKRLNNVGIGDEIIFNTVYGKYLYRVTSVDVADIIDTSKLNGNEQLVLYCSYGNELFSNEKAEKLYVVADLISGPSVVEEVK